MEIDKLNVIISAITGLISGTLASLAAPWVQWLVEKRKKKIDRRAALVDEWRSLIAQPKFDRTRLLNHPTYGVLRELLSDEARRQIERPANEVIITTNSPFESPDKKLLLEEIARIEKEWDLV